MTCQVVGWDEATRLGSSANCEHDARVEAVAMFTQHRARVLTQVLDIEQSCQVSSGSKRTKKDECRERGAAINEEGSQESLGDMRVADNREVST